MFHTDCIWASGCIFVTNQTHVPEMSHCPVTLGRGLWSPLGLGKGDCPWPALQSTFKESFSCAQQFSVSFPLCLQTQSVWWAGLIRLYLLMVADSSAPKVWGFFLHSLGEPLPGWFTDPLLGSPVAGLSLGPCRLLRMWPRDFYDLPNLHGMHATPGAEFGYT